MISIIISWIAKNRSYLWWIWGKTLEWNQEGVDRWRQGRPPRSAPFDTGQFSPWLSNTWRNIWGTNNKHLNHLFIASTASFSIFVQGEVQNFGSVAFSNNDEEHEVEGELPGPLLRASQTKPSGGQGSQAADLSPSDIQVAKIFHFPAQCLNPLLEHPRHPPGKIPWVYLEDFEYHTCSGCCPGRFKFGPCSRTRRTKTNTPAWTWGLRCIS